MPVPGDRSRLAKIGEDWEVLEGVIQEFMGEKSALNPVIGRCKDGIVLIDTGAPGTFGQLENSLLKLGFGIEEIKMVVITHYHFDHVGNLMEIAMRNKNARILMGKNDIPYYAGDKVPEEEAVDEKELRKYFPNFKKSDLDGAAKDEDISYSPDLELLSRIEPVEEDLSVIDVPGEMRIVATPGHTPGHLSVYLQELKALVAGDLMMYWKGNFSGPIRTFSSDPETADESVRKVSTFEIDKLIGYHGSPFFGNVNSMINEYLSNI
ncbi:hypothetical protein IX51_05280 [uncultured archaeon]|nr:hypothetical protein IX51_05280 [uncultured archaeon]